MTDTLSPSLEVARQPMRAISEERLRDFARQYAKRPGAMLGLIVFGIVVGLALAAPWISPQNPHDLRRLDIMDSLQPPGSLSGNGLVFWIGSDGQGRDMLSAILYGLRTSLMVGIVSGVIALIIGTIVGLFAAYRGGWVDTVIMRIVDLQLSLPTILLALVLLVLMGRGVDKIIFALVVVQWAYLARTVRGVALVENTREYMDAVRCLRLGHARIIFGHLLPNCLPTLIVVATVQIAGAISLEATLSFLGLGLPPTQPSLGLLIANGFSFMMSGKYWISVFP